MSLPQISVVFQLYRTSGPCRVAKTRFAHCQMRSPIDTITIGPEGPSDVYLNRATLGSFPKGQRQL